MTLSIDLEAWRMFLFTVLSCRCPVTLETEQAWFGEYFRRVEAGEDRAGLAALLAAADRNPARTPLHNLFDLCSYSREDPSDFNVSPGDVLRCFGSKFHYDGVAAGLAGQETRDAPAYLVCHLLTPVKAARPTGRSGEAEFRFEGRRVVMKNVFFPPVLDLGGEETLAVHMGTVLGVLSPAQALMVTRHLALIPGFASLVGAAGTVDFRDFQPLGDHRAEVEARFRRHFTWPD
ncbi:MAG: hypothetical protein AB1896_04085 [Thermodesulfobacteriota bacterium]